jgi:hypothetical protein
MISMVVKRLLPGLFLLGCSATQAQSAIGTDVSEKPCGIGEISRDKNVSGQVLISIPSRFHWKYSGSLVGGNVSIMIGEGFVYRYVQEGDKITTTNLGKYLALKDGETITLDQGNVSCLITPSLNASPAVLDVQMKMSFLRTPQINNFRLEIPN